MSEDWKDKGMGYGLAIIALVLLVVFLLNGCCSEKQIVTQYVTDTAYKTEYVHDSVDRWHTHYEFIKGDTMFKVDTFYRDRVRTIHDTTEHTKYVDRDVEVMKEVEKKVYVWWPCIVICALSVAGVLTIKLLRKVKQ